MRKMVRWGLLALGFLETRREAAGIPGAPWEEA